MLMPRRAGGADGSLHPEVNPACGALKKGRTTAMIAIRLIITHRNGNEKKFPRFETKLFARARISEETGFPALDALGPKRLQ